MESGVNKLSSNYWCELLANYTNLAKIPYDFYLKDYKRNIEYENLKIDDKVFVDLISYSCNNGLSIEIIIETIYGLILQKYTYEEDVVFGKTAEIIPLRIKSNSNNKFIHLVKKVQHQWIRSLESFNNYYTRIEEESLLKDKLINTLFLYNDLDNYNTVENLDKDFDIYITLKSGDSLEVKIGYNRYIYKIATIKRIKKMFEDIIYQILNNENIRLGEIEFVSNFERRILLNDFNDTKKEVPYNTNLIEYFKETVKKMPNRIALKDEFKSISYRDLDVYTDRLSGYLSSLGVFTGEVVAIMLPRGIDVVVSALAIMKCGLSFFPIDISNPKERIGYLLQDSKSRVVITCKSLSSKINIKNEIIVDINEKVYLKKEYEKRNIIIKPQNDAYMISTSGSTGRPKIISITHKSLLNMCFYSIDSIGLNENDICGLFLSFSFDAVMKQIFPYLLVGALVDIMMEQDKINEYTVNQFCQKEKVTVLALPTALGKLFIKNCDNKNIRVLQTGGEKLKGYKNRNYKIYNEYGPAEFTVISTSFLVDREYENIPIGKPVYNTSAYVTDRCGKICPIGVPGELCLSGVQISKGYNNNSDLNKKVFVKNPFKKNDYSEFMYKTGDLVRWLESGNLEYIGRLDNQVKIREYTIDLYEIENIINTIPEIKSSVCIAKIDEFGEKYIIAYYAVEDKDYIEINSRYIRKYLQRLLPEYMIPEIIVRLVKIPLTPVGKVNKRALPF